MNCQPMHAVVLRIPAACVFYVLRNLIEHDQSTVQAIKMLFRETYGLPE